MTSILSHVGVIVFCVALVYKIAYICVDFGRNDASLACLEQMYSKFFF